MRIFARRVLLILFLTLSIPAFAGDMDLEDQETIRELEQLQQSAIEKTLQSSSQFNHPLAQKLLKSMAEPSVLGSLNQILKSPYRVHLVWTQLGWLLLFFILRAWRLAFIAPAQWVKAVIVRITSSLLYLAVSLFIIPWLFFGDAYLKILKVLYTALLK